MEKNVLTGKEQFVREARPVSGDPDVSLLVVNPSSCSNTGLA